MSCEVVTFWIGQCGIQIGDASWELLCLEHEMGPDGRLYFDDLPEDDSFKTFFHENSQGQYVPRSLFIDLEPTVVDEIRTGVYRNLFHPEYIISNCEDASNNFARGFYKRGKEIIKAVAMSTRKLAESCDIIQALIANHSYGGGTGSGFSSMLMEFLAVEFPKISKLQIGIFPSPTMSSAIVEPYNAVLSIHTPMEISDLSMFMDNEALFGICQKKLNIENAAFTNLNRLQAQVFSGLTASFRFQGATNAKLADLQTNLVPYPRIHFPLISFAPIECPLKALHDTLSVKEITFAAFSKQNQLIVVDPTDGLYMTCVLLYRGEISSVEIPPTLHLLKSSKKFNFADWCPTGFKTGVNYQPMTLVPPSGMAYTSKSVTMLLNSTAIKSIITGLDKKFLMLYNKRAFVHWYVSEGMEESEFNEAYDDMMILEQDLVELESSSKMENNGEHMNEYNEPYEKLSESGTKGKKYKDETSAFLISPLHSAESKFSEEEHENPKDLTALNADSSFTRSKVTHGTESRTGTSGTSRTYGSGETSESDFES